MERRARTRREKFTRVGLAVKEFWYHLRRAMVVSRMVRSMQPAQEKIHEANRGAFKGTQVKHLDAVGTVKSDLLKAREIYEVLRS
jgi:hypothetical protein